MEIIKNILIIDDDQICGMINKKVINQTISASNVKQCESGNDALRTLRRLLKHHPEEFPDTIFLDVNMPVMDGWGFLERFSKFPQSTFKHCKVFMLSSSVDPVDIKRSQNFKIVHDFISKPLTTEKLQHLKEAL